MLTSKRPKHRPIENYVAGKTKSMKAVIIVAIQTHLGYRFIFALNGLVF